MTIFASHVDRALVHQFIKQELAQNLVSRPMIAERLGLPRSTVKGWVQRAELVHFPEPLVRVDGRRVELYWWPEVEVWYKLWCATRR